jgi:DNA polymerase I - 3''-5'' exonuclease and polymerase domains
MAKVIEYLLIYYGSAKRLHGSLVGTFPGFTLDEAKKIRAAFFDAHPKIRDGLESLINEKPKTIGCPLSGKTRVFYGPTKPTELVNFRCQTMAAHVINQAMLKISPELRWDETEGIMFQYHDALFIDTTRPFYAAGLMKECMETELELWGNKVKLPVEISVGRRWSEVREMSLEEVKQLEPVGT